MSVETRTIRKHVKVPLTRAKIGFVWYRHSHADGSRRHVIRPELVFDIREALTFRKTGIYTRRFSWWFPWSLTFWWIPRVFRGADEWCNDSICFAVPPFGCFEFARHPWHMRAYPCIADWSIMSAEDKADYASCGRLHGGKIRRDGHSHSVHSCCPAIARERAIHTFLGSL